jgi:ATP-dependent exoDNAse (exonuclease V) beta subunit
VSPGQHTFTAEGGYSVVWWDPGALGLGARPPLGVRREELIVKDVPPHVVADGRERYDRWVAGRQDARAAGSRPSLSVTTVGEWARAQADTRPDAALPPRPEATAAQAVASADVAIVDAGPADAERAGGGGAVFGTLVHAILAVVPFESTPEEIEALAALEARVCGLSPADAARAATKVGRVLAHDLLRRARRASALDACRRETPVTITLDDGTIVEGVVDLAFEEDGWWTVVDYKTDRELASAEDRYRRQVALYASAVAAATGSPVTAAIVRL